MSYTTPTARTALLSSSSLPSLLHTRRHTQHAAQTRRITHTPSETRDDVTCSNVQCMLCRAHFSVDFSHCNISLPGVTTQACPVLPQRPVRFNRKGLSGSTIEACPAFHKGLSGLTTKACPVSPQRPARCCQKAFPV